MNIFVLDLNPVIAAEMMCDTHVIKMVLESAQMLSTALALHAKIKVPCKPTHQNHPCNVWVRTSRENYLWLCDHFEALLDQFSLRRKKKHKYQPLVKFFRDHANLLPSKGLTPFAQAMYEEYRVPGDAVKAYRQYYNFAKREIAKWESGVQEPWWFWTNPEISANAI